MISETRPNNKILFYTLLTLIAIAVYVIVNSYNTQIRIFQEKELFKLDCIADAVSFKIDGDQHADLFRKYPSENDIKGVENDSIYKQIKFMLSQTAQMKMTEDISTFVYDSVSKKLIHGIGSFDQNKWMKIHKDYHPELVSKYEEGGFVADPYQNDDGTWLTAFSPIFNKNGDVAAVLQVDERFDSFLKNARDQIFFNLGITLIFILVLGTMMYFSVKSILVKQENVRLDKIQIDNLRKELLANVSHDLRTPLASIHGYLETIQMKKDTLSKERLDKYIATTLRNTEKLKKLVDELFDLSLLESKEKKMNIEPININDLSNDVINDFRIEANEKGIKMNNHLTKELPFAKGDTALIERVFQNIIGNSLKYCDQGDEISISTSIEDSNTIKVVIEDSGVGISDEDLNNIFDRFNMGKTGVTGTGLGLAIVKNILELHGYKYNLTSTENNGTVFTFYLGICHGNDDKS